ncbi:MAG: hypothetical protein K2J64_08965 [Desulfovibrio sp.]|nr:hypothetical protein [Desulfovibrio sp.]
MPNSMTTRQGYAWDQAALARLGAETQMGVLLSANVEEMDALLFGGGVSLAIPDVAPEARKSLPPWERM